MSYRFHSDPGHGWLRVPYSALVALGIQDQISRCSYRRNDFVYLEEDGDAGLFIRAYQAKHKVAPKIEEMPSSNSSSRIRSYPSYYTDPL